jgi:hypothetical protein
MKLKIIISTIISQKNEIIVFVIILYFIFEIFSSLAVSVYPLLGLNYINISLYNTKLSQYAEE